MSDLQKNYERWINGLSIDDHKVVFQRACVAANLPHSLREDGAIRYTHDLDDPDFQAALHQEYTRMYWGDAIEGLEAEGKIRASGVDPETGEVEYVKVTA